MRSFGSRTARDPASEVRGAGFGHIGAWVGAPVGLGATTVIRYGLATISHIDGARRAYDG